MNGYHSCAQHSLRYHLVQRSANAQGALIAKPRVTTNYGLHLAGGLPSGYDVWPITAHFK